MTKRTLRYLFLGMLIGSLGYAIILTLFGEDTTFSWVLTIIMMVVVAYCWWPEKNPVPHDIRPY